MTTTPTREQMENVAIAMGFESLLMLPESLKADALPKLHDLVQRSALGDMDASNHLAAMRRAIGKPFITEADVE